VETERLKVKEKEMLQQEILKESLWRVESLNTDLQRLKFTLRVYTRGAYKSQPS